LINFTSRPIEGPGAVKLDVIETIHGREFIEENVPTSEINRPLPQAVLTPRTDGEITSLNSTSEVFIPPRGRGYMKFSFDFPEPVVSFGEHRFGFLVFTAENTYALDRDKMHVAANGDTMQINCSVVWPVGRSARMDL
jgi:hypothetical protein